MKKSLYIIFLLFFANANCAHLYKESYYQEQWCNKEKGILEYCLNDDTRVDCLTNEYAIEFDFAPKWAESVGQSLYYALETGKKPGIVLILEKKTDYRYYKRAQKLAQKYNIQLWHMRQPSEKEYSENIATKQTDDGQIVDLIINYLKSLIAELLKNILT